MPKKGIMTTVLATGLSDATLADSLDFTPNIKKLTEGLES